MTLFFRQDVSHLKLKKSLWHPVIEAVSSEENVGLQKVSSIEGRQFLAMFIDEKYCTL